MKTNIPVKDIMSTKLITLHPKDKLKRAKEIFNEKNIHHIPVEVMGEIRGIISLGDILFLEGVANNSFDEFLRSKRYEMGTVDEYLTERPYCVDAESLLDEAITIMTEKRVNALLVKEDNKLVGILTSLDLMKYLNNIIK